uniref:7TM_GPCR_Srx domain-containing protein n=1 Tax=Steinernema glaseri TaxID=37863 RepID=A0A1I7ZJQ9_9BILA
MYTIYPKYSLLKSNVDNGVLKSVQSGSLSSSCSSERTMHTTFEVVSGIVSIFAAVVLPPIYIRIIYIFLANRKYRRHECYSIMIQMGVVQLLTVPGTFMTGYKALTGTDPHNVGLFSLKLYGVSFKVEALLSLVLGLNRLRIICGLRYPTVVHDLIIFACYLYGCAQLTILCWDGWIEFNCPLGEYLPKYNLSLPYTYAYTLVTSCVQLISTGLTFLLYISIISYLIWQKSKMIRIKNFEKEQTILIYATVRFAVDMSLIVLYNYITVPVVYWIEMCVIFTYFMNNLLLPPVLYLTLYKDIRRKFFACRQDIARTSDMRTLLHRRLQEKNGSSFSKHISGGVGASL